MASFETFDHRGSSLVVGQSVEQAKASQETAAMQALAAGRGGPTPTDSAQARRMNLQRLASGRVASQRTAGSSLPSVSFATQRPHDPMWCWQQNNMLYDVNKDDDLRKLRGLCRNIAMTHPVIGPCIDIFSNWPLTGMEFSGKDEEVNSFHATLFLDNLNYEEFLPLLGREYWSVGEAFPLGSFNEDLGVWEDDELINPDEVHIEHSPFLKDPRFYITLPKTLRDLLKNQQPRHEYEALVRSYPELKHFMAEGAKMPVSGVLMKHLKFRGDAFCKRGVPILYRALRSITQEEMLNSAQDAIADRLYTPLVLAKIGASASDLGTDNPWVPTMEQIADFEASLDTALAADFRVLTTHFAVNMETVFGKENMPNFDADFDRLTEKQLQVFGLSKTMLSGAGGGETYAADALNRDLVSQLLGNYQRYLKRFVRDRMLVVAEAQEHYDYEVRGGKRYVIMEEVLVVDEETGEKRIEEQPKLLVPDLHLAEMNMKDDEAQRQFFEALRAAGVPISMKTRLLNIPIDLDDEVEQTRKEQVDLAVEAQLTRKATYERLRDLGLPIPADLRDDFQAKPAEDSKAAAEPTRIPQLGLDDEPHINLAPNAEEVATPPGAPLELPEGEGGDVLAAPPGMAGSNVVPLPRNKVLDRRNPSRPEESDEMRKRMPKPAALLDPSGKEVLDADGNPVISTLGVGPVHVGARRFRHVTADTVLGDDDEQTG